MLAEAEQAEHQQKAENNREDDPQGTADCDAVYRGLAGSAIVNGTIRKYNRHVSVKRQVTFCVVRERIVGVDRVVVL
jgi:hypothetical protein